MLVAVLMIFTIFSFTGVAVLNVSYLSNSNSMDTINNIKMQYATESSINEALWRINQGVDSLVNVNTDGIATLWDPTLAILSVNVDKFQMEAEILLDLSEDTHFDRAIAAEESVSLDGYVAEVAEERQVRSNFDFLPEADIQYFLDNATSIHTTSFKTWKDNTFPDGIHVFTGSFIDIEDVRLTSGTMVFTGHHIRFIGDNIITADAGDTTGTNAALIFTNPDQNFQAYSPAGGETITGAIYAKGNIDLHNGNISGPIMGKNVTLKNNFNLLDNENTDRYRWTKGFGNRNGYDWPKQIDRWKTKKWNKKHNA
ncbi:MAG: hypothetical protein H8E18_03360 [FCB group bacterium]|nr:hypothetical protein [FCB group bacterium]